MERLTLDQGRCELRRRGHYELGSDPRHHRRIATAFTELALLH